MPESWCAIELRHEPIGSELFYCFAYLVSLGRVLAQGSHLWAQVSIHTARPAPGKERPPPTTQSGGNGVQCCEYDEHRGSRGKEVSMANP